MAFVVEDGTGLTNSNSYSEVAEFDAYHADRGVEISAQYNPTDKQRALVKATDYADLVYGTSYKGNKLTAEQALLWPRYGATVSGFPCAYIEGIPVQLKNAVNEYALRELITPGSLMPDPIVSETGLQIDTEYEKAGPLESRVKYRGSAVQTVKPFPKADRWMAFISYGLNGGSHRA